VEIAIALYHGVTALDAIGPYEPLSRLPGAEIHFVGADVGPKRSDTDALTLVAAAAALTR
jgi:putative intracellular protease/amidase